MGRLQDRVAIVTGAGQGIGLGVARAFASEGARVVIANRTLEKGQAAVAEIERDFSDAGAKAVYIETDVSNEASVRTLVAETVRTLGRIDILVNNATPVGGAARLEKMKSEALEDHLRVNYYGAFWGMQAAFPHMKSAGWGRVITMCSLNGVNAHPYTTMYNASKEAVRAMTRTAAVEWARHGITCNIICPAAVTPPWEALVKFDPKSAEEILALNPSGRMGDAEADIGPLAVFLASDESRYITGNTIHADGGGHINGVPWSFEPRE
jgi:NAD(P)-dependent dehydrogenase (short-subunit alcohol dehydrogenase family)